MKNKLYISLIGLAGLTTFFSCTDINHLHEPYLDRGEQIYLGKPVHTHVFRQEPCLGRCLVFRWSKLRIWL